MKKIVLALAVVLFVLNIGFKVDASSAELVTVIVDGRTIEFTDAPAYLDANGRVQVPVRFVGEALGACVEWDESRNQATFARRFNLFDSSRGEVTIVFTIGKKEFSVQPDRKSNAERKTMDTEAVVEQARTYVPVRYLAENLGATVSWDDATRTVTVQSKTMAMGNFVIPESYTDYVTHLDNSSVRGVRFDLDFNSNKKAGFESRKALLLHILSQELGQASLDIIDQFMKDHRYREPKDNLDHLRERFRDSQTGRQFGVVRFALNSFAVVVDD